MTEMAVQTVTADSGRSLNATLRRWEELPPGELSEVVWNLVELRHEGRMSWRQIRVHFGIVGASVRGWIRGNPVVRKMYEDACGEYGDDLALETVGISDEASPEDVAVASLRVKTRFRVAESLAKDEWGLRPVEDGAGKVLGALSDVLREISERKKMERLDRLDRVEKVIEGESVESVPVL